MKKESFEFSFHSYKKDDLDRCCAGRKASCCCCCHQASLPFSAPSRRRRRGRPSKGNERREGKRREKKTPRVPARASFHPFFSFERPSVASPCRFSSTFFSLLFRKQSIYGWTWPGIEWGEAPGPRHTYNEVRRKREKGEKKDGRRLLFLFFSFFFVRWRFFPSSLHPFSLLLLCLFFFSPRPL